VDDYDSTHSEVVGIAGVIVCENSVVALILVPKFHLSSM
jgi:hypothetical protein